MTNRINQVFVLLLLGLLPAHYASAQVADIPGDGTTTARLMVPGTFDSIIDPDSDQDGFLVALVSGGAYQFDAEQTGGSLVDTTIGLYPPGQADFSGSPNFSCHNASGVLAGSDDFPGGGRNSRITWTATQTGDHLLCVDAFGTGRGSGTYRVTAADLTPRATISAPPDTSIPIAETALGGTTLTVTLENTEYEASPMAGQFTLNLIPVATGVTVGGVVRDSATAATLTLAYTGSTGINANTRIGVTVLDAAHTGSGDLTTDNMLRVAATAPSFAGMPPIANQTYLANSAITDLTLPAAGGGEGTLSYSLAPNPPNGLAFDADTRILSGTPDTEQAATGYTYTVTAGDGNTATRSFTIEILNLAAGLTAVQNLAATERRGRVRRIALTWLPPATVPVGTVSSYEIQGCSATDTDCVAFITSNHIGAADASQIATLFRATFNFYRVRARTAAGVSPWANAALTVDPGVVVDPGTLPSMVQNLASSALADNSVTLTWEAPTDATSTAVNRYVVVRGFPAETATPGAFAPPGAEAVVTLAADVFTYADSGLLPGTEYLYEVFASSNAGDGEVAQLLATTTGTLTTTIAGANTGAITEGSTDSITGTLTITTTSGNSEFVAPINSDGEEQLQFSAYGIFTISAAGVWTYSLNYTLPRVRALTEGESVQDTFTVTAAAPTADGVAVTHTVTITVTGVNTRPFAAIRLVEGSTVAAGETLRLESDITDQDDDLSELTIAWTAAGGIGTFSAAASADTDWMVPAATPPDEYLLTLTVTDPGSASDTEQVSITVTPPLPLEFGGATIDDQTYTRGTGITDLTLPVATGGTGPYSYALSGMPSGLAFDSDTRVLSGTPDAEQAATTYTYTATDAATPPATGTLAFTIEVAAPAPIPALTIAAPTGEDTDTLRFTVSNTGGAAAANTVTFSVYRTEQPVNAAQADTAANTAPLCSVTESTNTQPCAVEQDRAITVEIAATSGTYDGTAAINPPADATDYFYFVCVTTPAGVRSCSPSGAVVNVPPAATATISATNPGTLTEANLSGATLTVTLAGTGMATYQNPLPDDSITLNSAATDAGVTATAVRDGDTEATLTLAFDRTVSDFDTDLDIIVTVADAAHTGTGDLDTGTVTVAAIDEDDIPGDGSTTTRLAVPGTFDSIINPDSDQDGFLVALVSGGTYQFDAESRGSSTLDTSLGLYPPGHTNFAGSDSCHNGSNVLAGDDDIPGGTNSRITWTATQTGDHLLCVDAFGTGRSSGNYRLTAAVTSEPPADDATLSALTLSGGATLTPDFDAGTFTYTADVGNSVADIMVTPTATAAGATITVNGDAVTSGSASTAITLTAGMATDIDVLVTATDGSTTRTYNLAVTRAAAGALGFGGETIDPQIYIMGSAITDLTLPAATGGTGPYSYALSGMPSGLVFDSDTRILSGTPNMVQAATSYTYTATDAASPPATGTLAFTIEVAAAASATFVTNPVGLTERNLDGATMTVTLMNTEYVDAGSLRVDQFMLDTLVRGVTVDSLSRTDATNVVLTLAYDGTDFDTNRILFVDIAAAAHTGTNELTTGTSTVPVTAVMESTNANLSALELSEGVLTPDFVTATLTYTAMVDNSVSSLTVTPTAEDAGAGITVDGAAVASGMASDPVDLDVGDNTIDVVVTAEDGAPVVTYTVTVTRATAPAAATAAITASTPSPLSETELDGATLTVTLLNTEYEAESSLDAAQFTLVTSVSGVTVMSLSRTDGTNVVLTLAYDGSDFDTNTTLAVTVADAAHTGTGDLDGDPVPVLAAVGSSDADLSALVLSAGAVLEPTFDSATTFYEAGVADTVSSLTVTPTAADAGASITVDGTAVATGVASGSIALAGRANLILVEVTAADGSTMTYTVLVTRRVPLGELIGALTTVGGGDLTEGNLDGARLFVALIDAGGEEYVGAGSLNTGQFTLTTTVPGVTVMTLSRGSATNVTLTLAYDGSDFDTDGVIFVTIADAAYTGTEDLNTNALTVTAVDESSDADLSALVLSESTTLSPTFDSAVTSYTASVADTVSSLTVTPTASDATGARITVDGTAVVTDVASGPITLNAGANLILVEVTAADGSTMTYTVSVTRASATGAAEASIALSTPSSLTEGNLDEATLQIDLTNTAYEAASALNTGQFSLLGTVPGVTVSMVSRTSEFVVVLTLAYDGSDFDTDGVIFVTVADAAHTGTGDLNTGTVSVTAVDESSDAQLSALALSAGMLTPTFASTTTIYTASVDGSVSELTVTPTASDAGASIVVAGTAVASGMASGPIALRVGNNPIAVVVTAADGTSTVTYAVTVTRVASTNADLSALLLSEGLLTPGFAPATLAYTAMVANSVSSLTITPTAEDAGASITVDGAAADSGMASDPVDLDVGDNAIDVVVTAEDGITIVTYTVTVTRATTAAPAAIIQAVNPSGPGVLSEANLDGSTVLVTLSNTDFVASTSVIEDAANYRVNGLTGLTISAASFAPASSGVLARVTIEFAYDDTDFDADTEFTVTVLDAVHTGTGDLTTATETVTAIDETSRLSALSLSEGALDPVFNAGTFAYAASVANSIDGLTVTPAAAAGTTITVDGTPVNSGEASAELALTVGTNTITVAVTAPRADAQDYTLTVTREMALSFGGADTGGVTEDAPTDTATGTLTVTNPNPSGGTEVVAQTDTDGTYGMFTIVAASGAWTYTLDNDNAATNALAAGETVTDVFTVVAAADPGAITDVTITITGANDAPTADAGPPQAVALSATVTLDGSASADPDTGADPANADAIESYAWTQDSGTNVTLDDATVVSPTFTAPNSAGDLVFSLLVNDGDADSAPATVTITVTDAPAATISATTPSPLTEANLDGATLTVTLTNTTYAPTPVANQFTLAGVTGVTVSGVTRAGNTEATLTLAFDRAANDFDANASLTVTVLEAAHTGTGDLLTAAPVTVEAIDESDVATLSDLTLSGVATLNETFAPGTLTYTADVANDVATIMVTPTATDATGATIAVNGDAVNSGAASTAIDLTAGPNTITVVVTAEDGAATQTYTLTVTRAAATTPSAAIASPDSLTEAALDGATVTVMLTNTEYVGTLTANLFTVTLSGGATGVSVNTAVRTSAVLATLTLAYGGTGIDTNTNLGIRVGAAGHSGAGDLDTATTIPVTATVAAPTAAIASPGALTEATLAGATVTVMLTNTEYVGTLVANLFSVTLSGGATGVSVGAVTRTSAVLATLTLAYGGTGIDADTTLGVTVLAAAHTGTGDLDTATIPVTATAVTPSLADATFIVAENTAANTNVGTPLVAAEFPPGSQAWAIVSGNTGNDFAINPATGQLSVAADDSINFEDIRSYTLMVSLTIGTAMAQATVTLTVDDVDEAPAAPAAPTVTAAAESLNVNWTAPANNGPAITRYDVQFRTGVDAFALASPGPGTATSLTITGLTANTAYEVQVRAVNDEGDGAYSASGSGTPLAAGAPTATITTTAPTTLTEANLNGAMLTVTLTNATYVGPLTASQFTLTGAPGAAMISVESVTGSGTQAVLVLAYPDAGADLDSDLNLSVVVDAAAHTGTNPLTTGAVAVADNAAPVIVNPGSQIYVQNAPITALMITVTDADGDAAGDPPVVMLMNLPNGLLFDGTDQVTGTPTALGDTVVTITATDGVNDRVTDTFTITVTPSTGALRFGVALIPAQSYTVNTAITDLTLPAATGGTGPYGYSLSGMPSGLRFDAMTRVLSGTPDTEEGARAYTYTAVDSAISPAAVTLSLVITVNAPSTTLRFDVATIPAQSYTVNAAITDLTLPAATGGTGTLSYTLSGMPSGLIFDAGTRVLSGTPDTEQMATTYTYTATDVTSPPAAVMLSLVITVRLEATGGPLEVARSEAMEMTLGAFGRSFTSGAVDVLGERFSSGAGGSQLTFGGRTLSLESLTNDQAVANAGAGADNQPVPAAAGGQQTSVGALFAGSAFQLSLNEGDAAGVGATTLWARGSVGNYEGEPEDGFQLDGDIVSGYLGLDYRASRRTLVGVAVSHSRGDADFSSAAIADGEVETELTSILPYVQWQPHAGLSLWGLVGYGLGESEITDSGQSRKTDVEMQTAALGARGRLWSGGRADVALKASALTVEIESDSEQNLSSVTTRAHRLRMALEGKRHGAASARGGRFGQRFELGLRWDLGDVETGAGADLGAGVEYANPRSGTRLRLDGHYLLVHEETDFEAWEVSAEVGITPSLWGRGVTFALQPGWDSAGARQRMVMDFTDVLGPAWRGDGLKLELYGEHAEDHEFGLEGSVRY